MTIKDLNSSLSFIPFILLFLLIMILLYAKYLNDRRDYIESFANEKDTYLYPIRDLEGECAKDGLKPAYAGKICELNGTLNSYANCKCADNNGNCKICYDPIKRDETNANIIYNAYPDSKTS